MPQPPLRDVNADTVELVKSFEGIADGDPTTVNLDPYLDPVAIWTIGWGHAIEYQGRLLRGAAGRLIAGQLYPGGITRAQAEALLRADLIDAGRDVLRAVGDVPLDDRQFGALVSFTFNVGAGKLGKSTLLKRVRNKEYPAAAEEFLRWTKGTDEAGVKRDLPGLVRRRRAERRLFLGEEWRE